MCTSTYKFFTKMSRQLIKEEKCFTYLDLRNKRDSGELLREKKKKNTQTKLVELCD